MDGSTLIVILAVVALIGGGIFLYRRNAGSNTGNLGRGGGSGRDTHEH